ncbi:MAG TPA: tetratricopeptide repeat protein, partial [Asticcacaulis sp.]|nr:tetratricopeptide repeat protein [Asticcacaulis sp.]
MPQSMSPTLPPAQQALLQQAINWHRGGRPDQARSLYRQILATIPADAQVLYLLGSAEGDLGNPDESVRLLTESLNIAPRQPGALFNRGNALAALGRFEAAADSYGQAVALHPSYVEAYCNQGAALQHVGRLEEALASYDKALAIRPDLAEAHNNRGSILHALNRFEEALADYDKALAINAGHAGALNNRGNALVALGRPEEALAAYDRILAFQPGSAEALVNRSGLLNSLGRFEEALAGFDKALAIREGTAEVHHNRGIALQALDRFEEAAASYDRALALDPGFAWLRGQALHMRMQLAQWAQFDEWRAGIVTGIARQEKAAVPFVIQALVDAPDIERQCAALFSADMPSQFPAMPAVRTSRHDRIHIGYFSSDFKDHPVSHLLAGMLERHDRSRFEVTAFATAPGDDPWRARIHRAVDRFVDVSGQADPAIVAQSRALGVDIAIDLNGHTRDGRTGVFAERAAPVQASYLGYLGTMGAGYYDYLFADAVLIPEASQPF